MKIFRLCLVKEEDNILEGAVVTAAPWADGIFLADNGSSDETPMAIERLTRSYPRVINIGPLAEPFYKIARKPNRDTSPTIIMEDNQLFGQ
ncbi:MAG: hypothetical protein GXY44_14430 [Phycisphaerales bacterium]|nr:hypothetical protein [Phycisphaerales bacterium]